MKVYTLTRIWRHVFDCTVSVHTTKEAAVARRDKILADGGDDNDEAVFIIQECWIEMPRGESCCRNGQGNWLVPNAYGGLTCGVCGIDHAPCKESDALYRIPITNSWYAGPKSAFDRGYDQIDWKKK